MMFLWHFGARIARTVLPPSFIKKLRGDRKSVHARWILDPKERLSLMFHRLKGGTYLSWYARRMDGFAAQHQVIDLTDGKSYFDSGMEDLEVIKKLGVKPHHRLHEFGCGALRSARYFIEYLDKGNFSANDTSGERITYGTRRWRAEGLDLIEAKQPLLIASTDNSFAWLNGRKVDYIWCHAVFGHMPPEDVKETVANMKSVLNPGGAIILTYGENPYNTKEVLRTSVKDWYHSRRFFLAIAAANGMTIEECGDDINDAYPDDDVLIMRPS